MKRPQIIDLIVFGFVFLFLLSFFEPRYLLSLTTATGGDMGSHFPTVEYLKNVLLPRGQVLGWEMGNYAGFPIFYHYFPLDFVINALMAFVIPMQIAFKLTTVLGTFLLPICAYLMFRLLGYPFPIPIIGAVLTLPFLFMEANSMWGGNIPSTLAGEYSYSLSLSLLVLFFGSLYRGVSEKKWVVPNGLLVAMIGLSHGFTFIFAGVFGLFFLFSKKDFFSNFWYLVKTYGLAFLLIGFWFLPFLANTPYVTSYVTRWYIGSLWEVIPLILAPFFILALAAFFLNLFDRRTLYFGWAIVMALILYRLSPNIGMLDIRWVPFIQLWVPLFSATALLLFVPTIKLIQVVPLIVFLVTGMWVVPNVKFIKSWIKWNYEGVELKASYPVFKQINDFLNNGDPGRVVYEHSPLHNSFGTERAFESLPYFAKRNTLEGLYMQSSISSPFVFYIQSQISKVCSAPFPQYKCSGLNVPGALPRLKLFNVSEYITRSPEVKQQAASLPELRLEKKIGDYEIYRLLTNDGHYVVPVKEHPIVTDRSDWKREAYDWFRQSEKLEEPVPGAQVIEKIGPEEIWFKTNLIGQPHLIKISYHPNWQVTGADRVYLAYPSFMLVYPTQAEVKLHFGKSIFNRIGEIFSLLGLTIVLASGIIALIHGRKS